MTGGLAVALITSSGTLQKMPAGNKFSEENESLQTRFQKTLGYTGKYLVAPTAILSASSGIVSFVTSNFLKSKNKFLDTLSLFFSKAALFSTAIFGGLQTARNNDLFGTVGYVSDFMVSIFAGGEKFYLWKGYGSAFDHSPAILMDVAHNPKIKEKYDNKGKQFLPLNSLWESIFKSMDATGIIIGDVMRDLTDSKGGNILKRLKKTFFGSTQEDKNRTAERNLLFSSIGTLCGAIMGTILPFERVGATIRDLFGIYADLAVYDKADSENSDGKDTGAGNKLFGTAGIFYTLGSVLDLLYRWTKMDNLNLLALGMDRVGNWCYVTGVQKDVDKLKES